MKKKFYSKFLSSILWVVLLFSTIDLFGQCDIIFSQGIYDFKSTSSFREKSSSFINWYKNQSIQTFQEAKSASANATIPLEEIMVEMGFSYNESGFREFQNYVESYTYQTETEKSKFDQVIRAINPNVVDAWNDCIKRYGSHIWVEHTKDPYEFVLCANFIDDDGGGKVAQITGLDFGSGSVATSSNTFYNNGSINMATILSASIKRQIFTRQNNKAFNIAVNVSRGESLLYSFAEILPIPPIPPIPTCPNIEIKTFELTSSASNRPTASVSVPEGYKIIGGGARVNYSGAGCLLTESYPNGNSWIVKAKDHLVGNSASVTAYAIAIYDPNNKWDVRVFQSTGSTANYPEATTKVDKGYIMTCGGAKVNWSVNGNLLTASYPVTSDTWKAKGKDHGNAERTNITVYAIGIKPAKKCSKKLENKIFQAPSSISNHPSGSVSIIENYLMTGGGTIANWSRAGSLLTSSYPSSGKEWVGSSKDHKTSENVSLDVYAIGIRYQ